MVLGMNILLTPSTQPGMELDPSALSVDCRQPSPNGLHHLQSEDCRRGRKLYQKRVQANQLRRQMVQVVTMGGVPLGAAQTHPHLGRLLACNDSD